MPPYQALHFNYPDTLQICEIKLQDRFLKRETLVSVVLEVLALADSSQGDEHRGHVHCVRVC